jgi:hypothetical protein
MDSTRTIQVPSLDQRRTPPGPQKSQNREENAYHGDAQHIALAKSPFIACLPSFICSASPAEDPQGKSHGAVLVIGVRIPESNVSRICPSLYEEG